MNNLDGKDNVKSAQIIENILSEIDFDSNPPAGSASDMEVDRILAELGLGDDDDLFALTSQDTELFSGGAMPPVDFLKEDFSAPAPEEAAPAFEEAAEEEPAGDAPYEAPAPREEEEPAVETADYTEAAEVKESLFDEEPEEEAPREQIRAGKASAMSKVKPGKYEGETELLSWFSQDGDINGRKDKKADKLAKKNKKEDFGAGEADGISEPDLFANDGFGEEPAAQTKQPAALIGDEDFLNSGEPVNTETMAQLESIKSELGSAEFEAETQALYEEEFTDEGESGGSFTKVWQANFNTASPWDNDPGEEELFEAAGGQAMPLEEALGGELASEGDGSKVQTRVFNIDENQEKPEKVPTAAYTQEFEASGGKDKEQTKPLFVNDMVDDKFRDFFSETAIIDRDDMELSATQRLKRRKRLRTTLLTDEFTQLAKLAEMQEDGLIGGDEADLDDYNRPQDAGQIEADIAALRGSLLGRTIATGVISLILLWMSLAYAQLLTLPAFISPAVKPMVFAAVYFVLIIICIVVNFSTVAAGIMGLGRDATVDTPVALAAISALLQAAVMLVQMLTVPSLGLVTLFGTLAALLMCFNNLGKWLRSKTVQANFKLTSSGINHSAAYVVDSSSDVVHNITRGLSEEVPVVLVNRPTTVVKGFLRQSFSRRKSDYTGRLIGWILLGTALVCGIISFIQTKELLLAISSLAAILCIGAPLSSTLLSAVPSLLMQRSATKLGAVIPGWTGIQDLGDVNVVMAQAKDIFPPSSIQLHNIKTFDQERVDLAIQYAASVMNAGCDTLRDLFMDVLDGKTEMLYKVENLIFEPGRGFTAWVNNSRVVIGNREILQKHDIATPPVEMELKHTSRGSAPLYLAISGKPVAMFIIGYNANPEVRATLEGFVNSGVSLLIVSEDMNVSNELIEEVYRIPPGIIKVLSSREQEMLEPLTEYVPASDGVMTHLGSFSSYIGGMRAAAGCWAAEHLGGIVQLVSVILATVLCVLLAFNRSLPTLSLTIILLYQIGWTVLISILPLSRKY